MDFLSRFLMINTIALGVALGLLVWNWRKTRNAPSPRSRIFSPKHRGAVSAGELENRAKNATSEAKKFVAMGEVSNEEIESLNTHQEAFYARYYAANVYLTQGAFKTYQAELDLAEKELAAIETVLKAHQPSPKSPSLAHSHS